MPNYRNNSKIVKREELVPPGKLEEGMIITFRYNTGSDKTPVVLVLYYDRKKKFIEGINLNYITISRVGRLVELMSDAKVSIDKDEFIDEFEQDITRIQLSAKKKRGNMTPEKFFQKYGMSYNDYFQLNHFKPKGDLLKENAYMALLHRDYRPHEHCLLYTSPSPRDS